MVGEPKEIFEREVLNLLEKELKPIKHAIRLFKGELQQLKNAHDAIANKHASELLDLERCIASVKINLDVDEFCSIIENSNQLNNKVNIKTELLAEASKTKASVNASNCPSRLVGEFNTKWRDMLRDMGAEFINY